MLLFYIGTMNQNWVQESILAWLWPHFHLVFWMRQDQNTQTFDHESSSLTTRPVWRIFLYICTTLTLAKVWSNWTLPSDRAMMVMPMSLTSFRWASLFDWKSAPISLRLINFCFAGHLSSTTFANGVLKTNKTLSISNIHASLQVRNFSQMKLQFKQFLFYKCK